VDGCCAYESIVGTLMLSISAKCHLLMFGACHCSFKLYLCIFLNSCFVLDIVMQELYVDFLLNILMEFEGT
jgi:hypothetical protein